MQSNDFQEEQSSNFDFKEIFFKYLSYFHWLVLGAIIGLTISFFYLRYATEYYQSSSVIKVLDINNAGFKLPSDGFSFFAKSRINLENEIEVLKSSLLVGTVVDELDLQNTYYVSGMFKETDIGATAPFYIKWLGDASVTDELITTIKIHLKGNHFTINSIEDKFSFNKIYSYNGHSFSLHLKNNSQIRKDSDYIIKKSKKINVINNIRGQLSVTTFGEQSELLKIIITSTNPQKSCDIANKLAEVFNNDGINDRRMVYTKTIDFVNERFAFLFKELDSIETNKANYKKVQSLSDFTFDSQSLLMSKSGTKEELNQAKTQALLSEILIETLSKTGLNDLLPVNIGLQQVDVNALTNQYNQIVLQLQKLSQTLGDNDPYVLQLKNSQKELKISLKSSLSTYRKMMQTKINEIDKISQTQTQQYAALPFQEKAIRSIERQQEIKETLYIILLQKREEAAVNLAIINPSIKIVDFALAEIVPISPKGNIIYLAGLVLGLTIPFLIIYIYMLLDTKIHSKSDVEKVLKNIPFIAEIPHIVDDVKMVKYLDRSVLSESFRMLRTNLGFLVKENESGLVLFSTSTIKGEGKTLVSMNLAITLSTLGKKVVLVGADLRNPQLHKMLNIVRLKKGVTNFLHDTAASYDDLIENGSKYNLKFDIIFSGTMPPNPAELLSNGRFELLLNELKSQYDYVIVDTAPTLLVTDTSLIANLADLVVYVIRANYTDKNLLNFINELKKLKKVNNIGFVLNNVGEQKGYGYKYGYKYGYSYGYNYGYGYGYKADEVKTKRKRSMLSKLKHWLRSFKK